MTRIASAVPVRPGRLGFRLSEPEVAEDPGAYPDRLSELARILCGLPWLLAGGLAIPVTLGRFYRRHYDVDIAFPRHAFPAIEAAMARAGFYLSTYPVPAGRPTARGAPPAGERPGMAGAPAPAQAEVP